MYVCIVDQAGETLVHRNLDPRAEQFLRADPALSRRTSSSAVECMFAWYWLADLCERRRIPFVLGHALYMKAIHGGKTKNDESTPEDRRAAARRHVPAGLRLSEGHAETRDLLRRRMYLVRHRAEAIAHIQNTISQYNLPPLTRSSAFAANRAGVAEQFHDESVRRSVESDSGPDRPSRRAAAPAGTVPGAARQGRRSADLSPAADHPRRRQDPGAGAALRDPRHPPLRRRGNFLSYCRLVRCSHESAGKKTTGGKKIGNAHLKWAFGEAACLLLRELPEAKSYVARRRRSTARPRRWRSWRRGWRGPCTGCSNERRPLM